MIFSYHLMIFFGDTKNHRVPLMNFLVIQKYHQPHLILSFFINHKGSLLRLSPSCDVCRDLGATFVGAVAFARILLWRWLGLWHVWPLSAQWGGGGGGPSKTSSNDFSCALQKAYFLVCIIILRINKTGGLRVMGTSMCGTGEGLGLPPSRKHLLRLAEYYYY